MPRRTDESTFTWTGAMAFAFGVLRLPPDVFWAMTPKELAAACRPFQAAAAGVPKRETLAALMAAHPDQTKEPANG